MSRRRRYTRIPNLPLGIEGFRPEPSLRGLFRDLISLIRRIVSQP